ncbi:mitochondrial genome maintenance exonuclease 1 [Cephus cinctus]|uniref:Mitochondrial genome maintenance exonuclease 1 n=1 Tax=Cephus cinctus TaxID=211228 RepID=A0AAJ7BIU3_CEPCN|nr:mitochondrial genome maintenance exonuclease 1 [Cephus cinctus]
MSCYNLPAYYSALKARAIQSLLKIHVREKNTKALHIKQLMKENKLLFGNLVETSKEKKKRLKLEKKGVIPVASTSNIDSEIIWAQKNGKIKLVPFGRNSTKNINTSRTILIKQQAKNTDDQSKDNILNSAVVDESAEQLSILGTLDSASLDDQEITQNVSTNKTKLSKEKSISKTVSTSVNSTLENKTGITVNNKTLSLPDIIINHITSFSIFDNSKKSISKVEKSSNILSLSQYENEENLIFPSVTRILSATMSEQAKLNLQLWKNRMIQTLGEEGFAIYQNELLENGKLLHSSIQSTLTGTPFEIPEKVKPSFESVQDVLKEVTDVKAIETHAVHSKLHYRGVVDCIAKYRGNLCVIDWKKSDKPKSTIGSTYDAPLQVASYIGALNADRNYSFEIKHGLVVVAYSSGNEASVYELTPDNVQMYWRFWLKRLQQYYAELKDKNINANLH